MFLWWGFFCLFVLFLCLGGGLEVCLFVFNVPLSLSAVSLSSGYSQEVVCYTAGNIPQTPSAPRLVRAGVTWISLQWNKVEGCTPEEVISYTLEIQEEDNVSTVLL